MTEAIMILSAKVEVKERIDAFLRELRSSATEAEVQRLPTMLTPAQSELTAGLSASSAPPSQTLVLSRYPLEEVPP